MFKPDGVYCFGVNFFLRKDDDGVPLGLRGVNDLCNEDCCCLFEGVKPFLRKVAMYIFFVVVVVGEMLIYKK